MKFYCKQDDDGFFYIIEDAPDERHDLIRAAFFSQQGNTFLKWYPKNMPDKEIIIPNYERLAPKIFTRNSVNWEGALDVFCRLAKKHSISFILTGSLSVLMQGVRINPTDIDIVVDVKDFDRMKSIFSKYTIEPLVYNDSLLLVKYFGRLCIENVWIDISAFPKKGYEINHIDIKCWNGHILYVQSLIECLGIYKAIGKEEYVMEIEECLRKS